MAVAVAVVGWDPLQCQPAQAAPRALWACTAAEAASAARDEILQVVWPAPFCMVPSPEPIGQFAGSCHLATAAAEIALLLPVAADRALVLPFRIDNPLVNLLRRAERAQ